MISRVSKSTWTPDWRTVTHPVIARQPHTLNLNHLDAPLSNLG